MLTTRFTTSYKLAFIFIFFIIIAIGGARPGHAQSFQLEIVAQVGDIIDGKRITRVPFNFVSLNDNGNIAILVGFEHADGTERGGIFTLDRLLVETGQTLHGKTLNSIGAGILNNNDDVIFSGRFDGGIGIFTLDELLAETGQIVEGKEILRFTSAPALNDYGEMLLHAVTANTLPNQTMLLTRSGIVAQTGVPIMGRSPINIASGVGFNNSGDVIFVDVVPYPSNNRALMTPDSVLLETGTIVDGKALIGFNYVSLNDARKVVFVSWPGIFSHDIPTGETKLLFEAGDSIDGEPIPLIGYPHLSEQGELSFFGVLGGSVRREALVADGEIVIKTGDMLDGKEVSAPGSFYDYNNKGELAFVARFKDGSRAVVFATRDSDGDGIPDDEDACNDSDLGDTVVISGCDTDIGNDLFADGCTLADIVTDIVETCTATAKNHGQAVSCVSQETNELKKAGLITGDDKGAIQSCLP